jgi:hypothetical protein
MIRLVMVDEIIFYPTTSLVVSFSLMGFVNQK